LSGTLEAVTAVYDKVPSRRLVVLGRAGSGKTILALRLALDLLDPSRRRSGDPVPVVFSLGSWDPTATTLTEWLTDRLIRDHPGLGRVDAEGVTSAGALVEAHLGAARAGRLRRDRGRSARGRPGAVVRQSPAAAGADQPSRGVRPSRRADRYLSQAAAIEVADLGLEDLEGYLPRTSAKAASPGGSRWGPVLATLRDNPDSRASVNLAKVLTTPLMVALARAVYSHNRSTSRWSCWTIPGSAVSRSLRSIFSGASSSRPTRSRAGLDEAVVGEESPAVGDLPWRARRTLSVRSVGWATWLGR